MHNREYRGHSTGDFFHRTSMPHAINTLHFGSHAGLYRGGICL